MVKKFALLIALAAIIVGCGEGQGDQSSQVTNTSPTAPSAANSKKSSAFSDTDSGGGAAVGLINETGKDRAQVRGATLEVRVSKLDDAEKKIAATIKSSGGFEESLTSADLASSNAALSIQAKVPVEKMDDVIGQIEGLGTRLAKSIQMEDVTAQLLAYKTQLKTQREEAWKIKNHKQDSTDYNNIEDIHQSIASLQSQLSAKDAMAAFSTLSLTIRQGAVPVSAQDPNWLAQAYGESSSGAASGFRVVATGLLWLLFMSPFYLPIVFAAWLVRRTLAKRSGPGHPPANPAYPPMR